MIPPQDLVTLFNKEFGTTLRMMHAFPPNKKDFTPHKRSQNALRLMSTFVFEMYLLATHLFGDVMDRSRFQSYKPETIQVVIDDFEKYSTDVLKRLAQVSEPDLMKTIEFGGRKFAVDEFALMMLHDQIHHRGQLSVYVRMAGGEVPSVYGPSADDASTNL